MSLLFIGSMLSTPSEARRYHHHRHHSFHQNNITNNWGGDQASYGFGANLFQQPQQSQQTGRRHIANTETRSSSVIGGRPSGCPNQYCGCSASLYLFGKIVPSLNLAANWFKFPAASPAPGMVAVRSHHVMVIVAQGSNGGWVVHDGNSGGHLTRVHERSLAGYSIRNPNGGSRFASL
jgi:hypothetical protein